MSDAPIADITTLWHRYGKRQALKGVSLTLHAGGLVGLIGPDGVGKSTLLAILAGAKQVQDAAPGQNAITVFGGDFRSARHRAAVCARIAYMPQGLGKNLYPDLTVRENIAFFSRLFGQDHAERAQRTQMLLTATNLAPFAARAAGKLSGGMRQKLGLCCALIHDPDLLILDEPTTGVDPLSRRQFWDLVDRMRQRRPAMSVIVATAYMGEAERFDTLVAMDDGVILATGTPAEIRRRTGTQTLDEAFIALLPARLRATRVRPHLAPLKPGQSEVAIRAVGLTRTFGDFTAVDDVSFTILRGEIFGFLGSNGCGKTTTMRMLTGLLPISAGEALLFGRKVNAADFSMRYRVGYMSQLFSLYTELTVRQNLVLHAQLYRIPPDRARTRIEELVTTCSLADHLDSSAAELPLGIRQRLALAVAIINAPEILILDEPTSGVDPLERDRFWALLGDLSRNQGVTIFISTHFMNEAALCDHILLMGAGRVLATGTPAEVAAKWGGPALEDAFIACLEASGGSETVAELPAALPTLRPPPQFFSPQRMAAYALRETRELRRDPIRLSFALFGMAFLMIVVGYGTNTDVDHLPFAAYDQDQTPESRGYLQTYSGSIFFTARAPITSAAQLQERLTSGELKLALDIPAGFGRAVRSGRPATIGAWIDGAMPFRAETTEGYVQAAQAQYLATLAAVQGQTLVAPAVIGLRFRYNQDFDSVNSLVPSTIALLLALIPAILMALAVVREKEFGSITNLYVTPVTRAEFILGKQLPYVGLAMAGFAVLALMAWLVFGVPVKGSIAALLVGTLIYVCATTAYGILISAFASTQIAALFATAMLTVIPATQFSGMLSPVSSLSGMGAVIGQVFPMSYYLPIAVGTFTKSLGFAALAHTMLMLSLLVPALLLLSLAMLRKQER